MTAPASLLSLSICARAAAFVTSLALLGAVAACNTHTGVSLRRPGTALDEPVNDRGQLPAPGISLLLSPNDKVRIRILPNPQPGQLAGRLAPHDVVRYSFAFQPGQYRILPGDQIGIHFAADSKLDFDPVVRPDGRIGLGFVATEIEAAGKTPSELATAVDEASRDRLTTPGASVIVTKANVAAVELSGEGTLEPDGSLTIPRLGRFAAAGLTADALAAELSKAAVAQFHNPLVAQVTPQPRGTTAGGLVGFDQSLDISADGLLLVPELGAFNTNGQTVAALQTAIQAAIPKVYPTPLSVLVALEASASRVIYIDGEVVHAGAYPLTPALTALRAISLAGGARETGDLRSVCVIHRETSEKITVYVTNLREFIDKAAAQNDLALAPQDIVIVPRTSVAKVNLWVEQYITRMLPFSRNVSYSYFEGTTRADPP